MKEIYKTIFTNGYFLEKDNLLNIESYLSQIKFLKNNEFLRNISIAGEGNMNLVLRAETNQRSFIVKQSRPWVEKYPEIKAPAERSIIEGQFYKLIEQHEDLRKYFPEILNNDKDSAVLILEDLGEASDYLDIYAREVKIEDSDISKLIEILSLLHQNFNKSTIKKPILNRAMRKLNAEHIFDFPLRQDNGLDLNQIQNGLEALAKKLKEDSDLLVNVKVLKNIYLADGNYLLCGDFYPGSWLNTHDGIKVIDPEFCFFGPVEFDLGVFYAHLIFSNQEEAFAILKKEYFGAEKVNYALVKAFAGIEIIRRIIGIAQLPLPYKLSEKENLLNKGRELLFAF